MTYIPQRHSYGVYISSLPEQLFTGMLSNFKNRNNIIEPANP